MITQPHPSTPEHRARILAAVAAAWEMSPHQHLPRPAYGPCKVVRTLTQTVRVTDSGWEEINDAEIGGANP